MTEAHQVITIPATLYPGKTPADLLLVAVSAIQAHRVILPHVNKICSAAQGLLELKTDQVPKGLSMAQRGISHGTMELQRDQSQATFEK